jgi:protein O-GlcNAc transferase
MEKQHWESPSYMAAVECLDGVLLGVRRSMVIANNVTFDSSLQSDFCNTDFCRSALLAGLTIGTWPIAITYKSDVLLDDSEWHEQLKIYRKKWSDHIEPDASSCFAQGNKLIEANEPQLAIPFYEQTIALNPLHSNAHFNLGLAYAMQNFYHLALPHFEHGVSLMPDASVYIGNVLNAKMRLCDWRDLQTLIGQIESRVLAGQRTCPPFQIISFSGSPDMQRKAASLWVEAYPALPNSNPFLPTQKQAGEKIRIAYFSADFRNHPVAYLTAEMFELHDKTQFELIAFSNGHAPQGDPYRARVVAAFDQFIDIRTMSDEAVVQLARQMKIDVAVDLTSLTQGGRTSILMARVAPVQMHYLGYPATTSAANVDYMIADEMLAPKAMQQHYSEKMLYLPHCFQVSDRYRPAASPISDRSASRMALGLPKGNFVFCSFCNSYKITPEVFDSWMRILQAAPQSVLMLYADSEAAQSNLRREAQARDVDANRLVFGTRVGVPDYLARLTNCDLFLDTLPYNGGTTANDALWMGLPLLTMTGETMTSRMAASLLHTLDLDELIATNWSDYEKKAVQLATQPARYTAIKQHLLTQREVSPLFDTTQTTRHIEHGYCLALERYWQGLAPDHLYVPA